MNLEILHSTARALVAKGKGILAMDESSPTIAKRFKKVGIEDTIDNRRAYRDLLITTAGLNNYISGAILYDETLRQSTMAGVPFAKYMASQGIVPGIKVDAGAKDMAGFPGEKVTEGLDKLRDRLTEYKAMGARFAKWRAVITIGPGIPTGTCIHANAEALARYAALCQEADIVPIVEPEVLIDGDHSIERCYDVSITTLRTVFERLALHRVAFEGMVLKASMVLSGLSATNRAGVEDVADWTVRCLRNTVPPAVAGVAFLSGGQSNEDATAHLNTMNVKYKNLPWPLTFSYSRALQQPVMESWRGKSANAAVAQKHLLHRARLNGAAATGNYSPQMEREAA